MGHDRPDTEMERAAAAAGARRIVGIDEVGRGALAGPVVAAAVALPWWQADIMERLRDVRDSKQLAPRRRSAIDISIRDEALAIGLGRVDAWVIDVLGVGRATALAMRRAVRALPLVPDHLLVDGRRAELGAIPQTAVIGGDRVVLSIAAASVVAKVARDAEMVGLARFWPAYGFDGHKGYAAPAHLRSVWAEGPTVHHRLSWGPLRLWSASRHVVRPRIVSGTRLGGDTA